MKKIVIATHGYMAKGIKSTLEMIAGNVDDVIDINAFTEDCPDPEPVISEILSQYDDEEILVMTDVYFGSVNQIFLRKQKTRNFRVITGINLPLIMDLYNEIGQNVTDERLLESVALSRDNLKLVKSGEISETVKGDDEEEL